MTFKEEVSVAFINLFPVLLTIYLLILLIDTVWNGIISAVFDTRYLLIGVILSGIVTAIKQNAPVHEKIARNDYIFIAVLSIAGSIIVWYKLQRLGAIALVISIFSGLLIFLTSIIVLNDKQENGQ